MPNLKLLLPARMFVFLLGVLFVILHLLQPGILSDLQKGTLNSLHAPGFGLLAISLLFARSSPGSSFVRYSAVGVIAALFAVVLELAQLGVARNADVSDLINDLVGIVAFLCLAAAFDQQVRARKRTGQIGLIALVGVAGAIAAIAPAARHCYALYAQVLAFPQLASFEATWERLQVVGGRSGSLAVVAAPANWPATFGKVAYIDLSRRGLPGLHLQPFEDWSGYDCLSFVAASGNGRSFNLAIRIHDKQHDQRHEDRFNQSLTVHTTLMRYAVSLQEIAQGPEQRPLQLSHIAGLVFFVSIPEGDETIYLDDLRLGPAPCSGGAM